MKPLIFDPLLMALLLLLSLLLLLLLMLLLRIKFFRMPFFLTLTRTMKEQASGLPRMKSGWVYDPVAFPAVLTRVKP